MISASVRRLALAVAAVAVLASGISAMAAATAPELGAAKALCDQGKWADAVPVLVKFTESAKGGPLTEAKGMLVRCYSELQDWQSAEKLCKELGARKSKEQGRWLYTAAKCLKSQGKYEEAIAAFEAAIPKMQAAKMDTMEANQEIGHCYERVGPAQLDAYLTNVRTKQPKIWSGVGFGVGHNLVCDEIDVTKGMALLNEIANGPKDQYSHDSMLWLVHFYRCRQDWTNADRCSRKVIENYPKEEMERLFWIADSQLQQKNYKEALPLFETAMAKVTEGGWCPECPYRGAGMCYAHLDPGTGLDVYLSKLQAEQPKIWVEVAYSIGFELIEQKIDAHKGLKLLEQVAALGPDTKYAREAKRRSVGFYRDLQEWANAEAICRQLISDYPKDDTEHQEWLAEVMVEQKRYDEGLQLLEVTFPRLAKAGIDEWWGTRSIVDCLIRMDSVTALDAYLTKKRVDDPYLWTNVAHVGACRIIDDKINIDKGMEILAQVAAQGPGHKYAEDAKDKLTSIYRDRHDWANADRLHQELLAEYPKNEAKWLYQMAEDLANQQKYKEALALFEKALPNVSTIGLDPVFVYNNMGGCYVHIDPGAGLDAYLSKLKAEMPKMWAEVAWPNGCVLVEQKIDTAKGIKLLNEVAAQGPTARLAKEAKERLVGFYGDVGQWENADKTCKELIQLYPKQAGMYLCWEGDAMVRQKKDAEAIPFYEAAIPKMPEAGMDPFWAYDSIAHCLMRCDHDGALDAFLVKLKAVNPDWWASLIFTIGAVMVEQRIDVDRGLELMNQFVNEAPQYPAAIRCKAEIAEFKLWAEGKPDEARPMLQALLDTPGVNNDELNYSLAFCSYDEKDYPTAISAFQSLYDKGTDTTYRAAAKFRIAYCHKLLGDLSSCERVSQEVVTEFPDTQFAKFAADLIKSLSDTDASN